MSKKKRHKSLKRKQRKKEIIKFKKKEESKNQMEQIPNNRTKIINKLNKK